MEEALIKENAPASLYKFDYEAQPRKSRYKILLVDDSRINLEITKRTLEEYYDTFIANSAREALKFAEILRPDLILLDIEMPDMNGYEAIKIMKERLDLRDIPVIFLTGLDDPNNEVYGLSLGAIDYIKKPYTSPLLLKRLELHFTIGEQKKELLFFNHNLNLLVEEKTHKIEEMKNEILSVIAEMVEFRDNTTGGHIVRTRMYLEVLIKSVTPEHPYYQEVSEWDTNLIINSSQLHDVGKIAISDAILLKPGKLSADEFEKIKVHTTIGAEMIEKIAQRTIEKEFLAQAAVLALSHHERWDGTGYPKGLSGNDIPLQGRFMAIADVYDALVCERPYKPPLSHEEVVDIMTGESGKHFDPILIELFKTILDKFKYISQMK